MKWFKRGREIMKVSEDIQLQEMPVIKQRCHHDWERVGSKSMWVIILPHPTDCFSTLSKMFNTLDRANNYRSKLVKRDPHFERDFTVEIQETFNQVCLKCGKKSLLSNSIKRWASIKRDEVAIKIERRNKAKRLWEESK